MARSRQEKTSEMNWYETQDIDGNIVRIPISSSTDRRTAEKDDDGLIPEFVNITKNVQQIMIQEQPNDTLIIPPMGIIFGAQHRKYIKPAKAWGMTPPFMERVRATNGEYDPVYILTDAQMLKLASDIKGSKFGRTLVKIFLANGKKQKWDDNGIPLSTPDELLEDRSKVVAALSKRLNLLQAVWEQRKTSMETGEPIANPITI